MRWRIVAWAALGIAVIGGLFGGVAAVLVGTEAGTAWILRAGIARAQGRLTVGSVSGSLADTVVLRNVTFDLGGGVLHVDTLTADVDLAGLLARAIVLESVQAGRVTYTQIADAPVAASASRPPTVLVLVRSLVVGETVARLGDRELTIGATRFAARYVDGRLGIDRYAIDYETLRLEGHADLDFNMGLALRAESCVTGSFEQESVAFCANLSGSLPRLELMSEWERPFAASLGGSLDFSDVLDVDLELEWRNAALAGFDDIRSESGRLRITGPLQRVAVEGSGRAAYRDAPFDFVARVERQGNDLAIRDLTVSSGDARVQATGELAFPSFAVRLDVTGTAIDPGMVADDWQGKLDFRGEVEAFPGPAPSVALRDVSLRGELRGYPIVATGGVSYVDSELQLHDVDIASRRDRLELVGVVGDELDLSVVAEISDLGLVSPALSGELNARFVLGGERSAPRVRGGAEGLNLAFRNYAVDRIELTGMGGTSSDDELALVLETEGLRRGTVRIAAVSVRLNGTAASHELSIAMTEDEWTLEGRATGGLVDASQWQGSIEQLTVTPPIVGVWSLAAPAALSVGRDGVLIAPACLEQARSKLCLEASMSGAQDDVLRIRADEFDIRTLAPLFPEGFDAAGIYELSMTVIGTRPDPAVTLSLSGVGTELRYELSERDRVEYTIDAFDVSADLADARLAISGSIASEQAGNGTFEMRIDDVNDEDSPIDGDVQFVWRDTGVLSLASPEIGDVSGLIDVNMNIGGTLGEPSAAGNAEWRDGTVEVPNWGLTIDRIQARVVSVANGALDFAATGMLDQSPVELTGSTRLDPAAGWPTTIHVTGQSLKVVQLTEMEVEVSPDLLVDVELPKVSVRGNVDVPSARVTIFEAPAQAISPSQDAVVHGREQAEVARPLEVSASIRLALGDDVVYTDGNLSANVTGELALEYLSGRPATATGTLSLSGQYDAYGNPLALDQGQLVFAGPWNNPALDVRAVRVVDDVTVGVQLTGTLEQPETRIFSEPPMSEAEALSYMLLGRPLERAQGQESDILRGAAVAMGLRQAVPAIERFGQTLGLDELTVQANDTDTGALMAGKYLSPKLYVRYSYGLFNRIGGLLLRYRINNNLSLETQSGEQNSMDLLYTIEKD